MGEILALAAFRLVELHKHVVTAVDHLRPSLVVKVQHAIDVRAKVSPTAATTATISFITTTAIPATTATIPTTTTTTTTISFTGDIHELVLLGLRKILNRGGLSNWCVWAYVRRAVRVQAELQPYLVLSLIIVQSLHIQPHLDQGSICHCGEPVGGVLLEWNRFVDDAGCQRNRFSLPHTFLYMHPYPERCWPYQLVDLTHLVALECFNRAVRLYRCHKVHACILIPPAVYPAFVHALEELHKSDLIFEIG
mmetsp:Transcript_28609/g.48034  ORF Transcript_28609/g.48034 Transcript_28609/m.48034 type:complete len:251 (-) Transcript_28609:1777-2529(-)